MKKNKTTNGRRKTRGKAPASKPYWEMTTAELREATKEFDQEFIGETFRPANAGAAGKVRACPQARPAAQGLGGQDHLRHGREAIAGPDGSARQEASRPPCRSGRPRATGRGQRRGARRIEVYCRTCLLPGVGRGRMLGIWRQA